MKTIILFCLLNAVLTEEIGPNYVYIEEVRFSKTLGVLRLADYSNGIDEVSFRVINYIDFNDGFYERFEKIC